MKPVDVIILALTVFVGLALCIPLIGQLINEDPFNEGRAKTIASLVASSIAIISIYVGAKLNDKDK